MGAAPIGGPAVGSDERAATPAVRPGLASKLLGWLLLALWIASFANAWMDGVRPATLAQLDGDRTAGQVQEWFVTTQLDDGGRFGFAQGQWQGSAEGDPSQRGGIVVWRAHDQWWAASDPGRRGSVVVGVQIRASADSESAVAALRADGIRYTVPPAGVVTAWILVAMLALWFGLLVVPVQRPRRGSRWFWFWIGLVPFGVGMAAYAIAERIRPRRAPSPRPGSGWLAFGLALLGAFVVAAALGLAETAGVSVPLR